MSWESYITNRLMNFNQFGHVYNNVLTDAIIIDFKGKILATTGISINYLGEDDVKNLEKGIDVYGAQDLNKLLEDFE